MRTYKIHPPYSAKCIDYTMYIYIVVKNIYFRGDREPIAAIYAIGSDDFAVPMLPETFSDAAREFVRLCLLR